MLKGRQAALWGRPLALETDTCVCTPAQGLASSGLDPALIPGVRTRGAVGREDNPALWASHGPLYFVGADPVSNGAKPMDKGRVWPGWSP